VLNVGDLSYADGEQPRWDSYGRLVQKIAAVIPHMTIEVHAFTSPVFPSAASVAFVSLKACPILLCFPENMPWPLLLHWKEDL
jgi:hypothetical protein